MGALLQRDKIMESFHVTAYKLFLFFQFFLMDKKKGLYI